MVRDGDTDDDTETLGGVDAFPASCGDGDVEAEAVADCEGVAGMHEVKMMDPSVPALPEAPAPLEEFEPYDINGQELLTKEDPPPPPPP